ncbi:MAG: LytTR family transcriptional regulator [Bacteroidales bacterium]|nr:LytTR family transcriptional regulator [Bacteroidales bacterium]
MKITKLPPDDPSVIITLSYNCYKRMIPVRDILYCQAGRNYTKFFFTDGSHCLDSKSLKEIQKTLEPYGFLSIHKSYLVNGRHIRSLVSNGKCAVTLSNRTEVEVSRRRIPLVNKFFSM